MEARVGNVIVNVDEQLNELDQDVIRAMAKVIDNFTRESERGKIMFCQMMDILCEKMAVISELKEGDKNENF